MKRWIALTSGLRVLIALGWITTLVNPQPAVRTAIPAAPSISQPQDVTVLAHAAEPTTFNGYACTVDCSGHRVGYAWAEEHGINNSSDCPIDPHNSHSFTEGCQAFAEDKDHGDERPY